MDIHVNNNENARAVILLSTIDSINHAEAIVKQLLEERLIACANLIPQCKSMYWWKGGIESAQEIMIVFKSMESKVENLMTRLKELHPYDVPEILVIPVERGDKGYLDWIREEVG